MGSRRNRQKLAWPLVAVMALLHAGCSSEPAADPLVFEQRYEGHISSVIGKVGPDRTDANDPSAPDFHWHDGSGALDSLSGHTGRIVVLNFFAMWCGPCHEEAPAFESVAEQLKDSVDIIGIDVDGNGNVFQHAKDFSSQHHLTYQIVTDSLFRIYDPYVFAFKNSLLLPYTIVIDRYGSVRTYHEGSLTADMLKVLIAQASD